MSKSARATSTSSPNVSDHNTDADSTDRVRDQERLELVYRCPKCRREVTVFVQAVVICANCQRLMKPTKTDQDTLFAQAS
ncbi:MAG: hypothetical protein U5L04_01940 [Trueperaceae bacterium]|nr:hypothetical protein [Trueperaceae bacterium]